MLKSKIFLSLLFVCTLFTSNAQIDLSINPANLILFGRTDVSGEFGIQNDIGVEGIVSFLTPSGVNIDEFNYDGRGIGLTGLGKYYFGPKSGIDKFALGVYMNYKNVKYDSDNADSDAVDVTRNAFSTGIYTGYKSVSSRNIVFEIGFGLGRYFQNEFSASNGKSVDLSDFPFLNIDWFGKLGVGYRF